METNTQKYPGSDMTLDQITEVSQKIEKIILDSLPESKRFQDAEIIMLQFVGAIICGSLQQPRDIQAHIIAFGKNLQVFANIWIEDNRKKHKEAKNKIITK